MGLESSQSFEEEQIIFYPIDPYEKWALQGALLHRCHLRAVLLDS
jgi:hypothetical protein